MSFELLKELGIQKALVADLDLKNRSLRELAGASDRKLGDLEEQMNIKKYGYDAHIKRLTEEIERVKHFNSVLSRQKDLLQENNLREQREYEECIVELREKVATHDTVVGDLTDDLLRASTDIGRLKDKLEKLEKKNKTYKRLEEELERFE